MKKREDPTFLEHPSAGNQVDSAAVTGLECFIESALAELQHNTRNIKVWAIMIMISVRLKRVTAVSESNSMWQPRTWQWQWAALSTSKYCHWDQCTSTVIRQWIRSANLLDRWPTESPIGFFENSTWISRSANELCNYLRENVVQCLIDRGVALIDKSADLLLYYASIVSSIVSIICINYLYEYTNKIIFKCSSTQLLVYYLISVWAFVKFIWLTKNTTELINPLGNNFMLNWNVLMYLCCIQEDSSRAQHLTSIWTNAFASPNGIAATRIGGWCSRAPWKWQRRSPRARAATSCTPAAPSPPAQNASTRPVQRYRRSWNAARALR